MLTLHRIVCPIDFSTASKQALTYAKALSSWYDARLIVFHVCVDLPVFGVGSRFGHSASTAAVVEEAQLEHRRVAVRQFAATDMADAAIDVVIREGSDATAEILREAAAHDRSLIVMGTHGRSGIDHML